MVSNTVNLAQGSTMMLGAVSCFTVWVKLGWPLSAAVPIALLGCAAWGILVERLAVRPFVERGSNSWLIATVALGIVVDNVVLAFGKAPRGMPPGILTTGAFSIADPVPPDDHPARRDPNRHGPGRSCLSLRVSGRRCLRSSRTRTRRGSWASTLSGSSSARTRGQDVSPGLRHPGGAAVFDFLDDGHAVRH